MILRSPPQILTKSVKNNGKSEKVREMRMAIFGTNLYVKYPKTRRTRARIKYEYRADLSYGFICPNKQQQQQQRRGVFFAARWGWVNGVWRTLSPSRPNELGPIGIDERGVKTEKCVLRAGLNLTLRLSRFLVALRFKGTYYRNHLRQRENYGNPTVEPEAGPLGTFGVPLWRGRPKGRLTQMGTK